MSDLLRPFKWTPTGKPDAVALLWARDPKEYHRQLKNDALCRWNRLMLRYEQLDTRCWWWAVYGPSGGVNRNGVPQRKEVASSNDHGAVGANERSARLLAEGAAIRYLLRCKAIKESTK